MCRKSFVKCLKSFLAFMLNFNLVKVGKKQITCVCVQDMLNLLHYLLMQQIAEII